MTGDWRRAWIIFAPLGVAVLLVAAVIGIVMLLFASAFPHQPDGTPVPSTPPSAVGSHR